MARAVDADKTSASLTDAAPDDVQRAADDAPPVCPPHTTERRLVARIDLRVVPFLCVMYLLAFLGEPARAVPIPLSPK